MPPLVMGCLWTRFPLRSHGAWLKWLLSFSNSFQVLSTEWEICHQLLLAGASLVGASSFICLPLPPSADVNTRYHHNNQDYQQDQRHNDSDAPWETDRREIERRDEELRRAEMTSDCDIEKKKSFKRENLCICLPWALGLAHEVLATIQLSTHIS